VETRPDQLGPPICAEPQPAIRGIRAALLAKIRRPMLSAFDAGRTEGRVLPTHRMGRRVAASNGSGGTPHQGAGDLRWIMRAIAVGQRLPIGRPPNEVMGKSEQTIG